MLHRLLTLRDIFIIVLFISFDDGVLKGLPLVVIHVHLLIQFLLIIFASREHEYPVFPFRNEMFSYLIILKVKICFILVNYHFLLLVDSFVCLINDGNHEIKHADQHENYLDHINSPNDIDRYLATSGSANGII